MRPTVFAALAIAVSVAAFCGCGKGTATPAAPTAEATSAGDREFVAKASPAEAIAEWLAALKADGISAHARCSLNERNSSDAGWGERAATVLEMAKAGTLSLRSPIIHEGFAVALLRKPGPVDCVCAVKTDDGWCVLESVSTWEAIAMARYGDGSAMNTINLKKMEAQLAAAK